MHCVPSDLKSVLQGAMLTTTYMIQRNIYIYIYIYIYISIYIYIYQYHVVCIGENSAQCIKKNNNLPDECVRTKL